MIEVLSPAGTVESFKAAINAGADAVYLGGDLFGARAYAGNFNREALLEAIDYAHIRGKKVYLTVNTLLKNNEIDDLLYDYLLPYYREGLDAVIVQDYGVFEYIKNVFPNMDLHASTQMTITSHYGAKQLYEAGAKRIVTARELTLDEIALIRKELPELEIESFVHGALCYCYSGQCLMSGIIGGRSGNRGRCAQACRLNYEVFDNKEKKVSDNNNYILSPKDMCAIEILPKVIEAGVNSLKIEGRMKSPVYTAGVVSIYRKYVDRYLEFGKEKYNVSSEDYIKLMDLFNRGNFTTGYYNQNIGIDMMSMKRPNHQGVAVLKVTDAKKGQFSAKPLKPLFPGDVIEIAGDYNITIGAKDVNSKILSYKIPSKFKVEKGATLYRTHNEQLKKDITQEYIDSDNNSRRKINMNITLTEGKAAELVTECDEILITTLSDMEVSKAVNKPMTEEQIIKNLNKLGNTPFLLNNIKVNIVGDIFIPASALNELRRKAIEDLCEKLVSIGKRDEVEGICSAQNNNNTGNREIKLTVLVNTIEQFNAVIDSQKKDIDIIYIDAAIGNGEVLSNLAQIAKKANIKPYIAFPQIFRKKGIAYMDRIKDILKKDIFEGCLIRSLCELKYLEENDIKLAFTTDHNMYTFNHYSKKFLEALGAECCTVPLELNEKELGSLDLHNMEIVGYGYYPMMISAQCVRKNTVGCDGKNACMKLKDRKNSMLYHVSKCSYCYSYIYNEKATYLMDYQEEFEQWGISRIRMELTVEDYEKTREVLAGTVKEYTRGHFAKGVE